MVPDEEGPAGQEDETRAHQGGAAGVEALARPQAAHLRHPGLELGRRQVAPIGDRKVGGKPAVDHLEGGLQTLPGERRAQRRVARGERLPGGVKGLGKDRTAQIADHATGVVERGGPLRVVEGVEQDAALERRGRVQVLDLPDRLARPGGGGGTGPDPLERPVERLLVQVGEGEVGRRGAPHAGGAVLDQGPELAEEVLREALDRGSGVATCAVAEGDPQPALPLARVHRQLVPNRPAGGPCRAGGLARGDEERALVPGAIDPAHVVEGDPRKRCGAEARRRFGAPFPPAQQAVTQTPAGHRAQGLLHDLEAGSPPIPGRGPHGQPHGIGRGEPAHGPGEIDLRRRHVAPETLQLDHHRSAARPAAEGGRQGAEQEVVGAGPVGRPAVENQTPGLGRVELDSDRAPVRLVVGSAREVGGRRFRKGRVLLP
jgi:hypothetical protein